MNYRFHHVHLTCRDLELMITFFTETIGANLLARRKFGTADGASIDLGGTTINLRVAREDEEMIGDASQTSYGYDHLGLEVEDIEAAHKALSEKGYTFFIPPREVPGMKIAFFKGPEDITIEILQPLS